MDKNFVCRNKEIILKQFERMQGQFVICNDTQIKRFIGIAQDIYDYYYILYDGRNIEFSSCVGTVYELKRDINPKAYQRMIRIAQLNHYDQLDTSGEHIKELISSIEKDNELLTPLNFDLN